MDNQKNYTETMLNDAILETQARYPEHFRVHQQYVDRMSLLMGIQNSVMMEIIREYEST